MNSAILAGFAYFVFVFLKAFQQRNVMGLHYSWIMPISYAMAATEVFVISVVAIKAVNYTSMTDLLVPRSDRGNWRRSGRSCRDVLTQSPRHNEEAMIKHIPDGREIDKLSEHELRGALREAMQYAANLERAAKCFHENMRSANYTDVTEQGQKEVNMYTCRDCGISWRD